MSRDTLRRGVVVRSSNDPRSREGIATISLRAIACLPVSNESMSLPEVDNIDEDDIENESPQPIGLPGRRPARRRTRVQRKNTGEVINDETAGGEMVVEYLRSRGRLREEDVEDFFDETISDGRWKRRASSRPISATFSPRSLRSWATPCVRCSIQKHGSVGDEKRDYQD